MPLLDGQLSHSLAIRTKRSGFSSVMVRPSIESNLPFRTVPRKRIAVSSEIASTPASSSRLTAASAFRPATEIEQPFRYTLTDRLERELVKQVLVSAQFLTQKLD